MMSIVRHALVRRQVERLVVRGLGVGSHRRLRDHLRACPECRGYYDRLRQAEDALFPRSPINPAALERLSALVVAPPNSPRRWSPARQGLIGLVVASATLVLAVAFWPRPVDHDTLTSRGGLGRPLPASLSVFAIDPAAGRALRLPRIEAGAPIKAGTVLQLAYSNSEFAHALVVGVDAHYDLQWYHPADTSEMKMGGVSLRANVVDEPFGNAWALNASPGPLRLYAVFAREPITAAQVEQALASMRREGTTVRHQTALPALGSAQDSVLLEVQP